MDKGQKQHYVPEVYLNNFSFDEVGNLYNIRIKPYTTNLKIKSCNKSSVCYKPNHYKFKEILYKEDKIKADPNYIENNLFEYENKFITLISEKINNRKNINLLEAEKLIRVLLSIKHRNHHFKKQFQGSEMMKIHLEKEIQKLRYSTVNYRGLNAEKYEAIMDLIANELRKKISDDSQTSDLFNDQLLRAEELKDTNQEGLIKEMSKSRFIVFCANETRPFITSDNPGYTVHPGDLIGNLFFGSAIAFAFPISKTRLFVIYVNDRDGNDLLTKNIKYVDASEATLKFSNKATIINSEEKIFSNSKVYLEELLEEFDFVINDFKK